MAVLTLVGFVLDANQPLTTASVPALLYAERIVYGTAKHAAQAAVASIRALAVALQETEQTATLFGEIESRLNTRSNDNA